MKKFWKNLFLIIIIALPLTALLFYIDSKQKTENEQIEEQIKTEQEQKRTFSGLDDLNFTETEQTRINETEIEKATTLKQTAWIPPWDYSNSLKSLDSFESDFQSISPVTFQINNDGSLTERLDPNLTELKKIVQNKKLKLIPTISNFDSNMMKNIFDSRENTQRHIQSILQVVKNYEYDGIDLDYESIKEENKENFLTFIEILSKELKKENKILSVTVLPKWGEGVIYTALAETREVQDWEILGNWADEIRIMAYDFTPTTSSKIGPIAPIDWVEKILEYATEKIPREKIWLGIHLYSYEWVIPAEDSKEKVKTNSYTYSVLKEQILKHEYVNKEYNREYKEGYAEYTCIENQTCMLYYATPESVKTRKELAKKYNIAGVAYWRLGGEDELIR
jgi:spore germination protein